MPTYIRGISAYAAYVDRLTRVSAGSSMAGPFSSPIQQLTNANTGGVESENNARRLFTPHPYTE